MSSGGQTLVDGVTGRGATAVTVQLVEDANAFAALRPQWNELLRASVSDNPFLTWEWQHTWWDHLRESSALRLVVVRSGDELIAIAPLRLAASLRFWFSRLEFLGTGYAGSDYLDLIVRRGRERESVTALVQYFKAEQLGLRFTHLSPRSVAAQLAAALATHGWISAAADDGTCPIIPLAGHTFDSYLATLGSSTAFMTPAARAFQDHVTERALAQGWLFIYVLRLNGKAAGVMYGFNYRGRFYFYQHGFDDRYKAQSLGLVLMAFTIDAVIDEGAREFDMLWGVEPYKFLWARDVCTLQRIELFPPTIGGTLQRHGVEIRRKAGKLTRHVLSIGKPLGA
jgi:CelD/BcsL family acetyltransferase involved in cellulose biosynthesis